jgi:hypothetical protein
MSTTSIHSEPESNSHNFKLLRKNKINKFIKIKCFL